MQAPRSDKEEECADDKRAVLLMYNSPFVQRDNKI